jgi:hypothetical protein
MDEFVDVAATTEMAIVDVFTKLIFGEDQQWNEEELSIVQALRQVDQNITMDNRREMGTYLRALGVQEMIKLVSRVKSQMQQGGSFGAMVRPEDNSAKALR